MTSPTPPAPWADVSTLRGMLSSYASTLTHARTNLSRHMKENPGYIAWSGGRDSTVAVHLATRINPEIPVVWFDSGLEYPETRQYINSLVNAWGLNFHIYYPQHSVLDVLRHSGSFTHHPHNSHPGEPRDLHSILVSEPSQRAHRDFGAGEVTGVRAGESAGRRIFLVPRDGLYTRNDGAVVCAPLWRWTSRDVGTYLHDNGIPENPVYEKLRKLGAPDWAQRVGLVVDGNAAEYGRFTWLRLGWPQLWSELTEALPRLQEWR